MLKTVHTSRTMMYREISLLLDYFKNRLIRLDENDLGFLGKASANNAVKTIKYLRSLYLLDDQNELFRAFRFLWDQAPENERKQIALLMASKNDVLLSQSKSIVIGISAGENVPVEQFMANIELKRPKKYSSNTLLSTAQNLSSSWKQAEFIEGKFRCTRVNITTGFHAVLFAMLPAYLKGERGAELFNPEYFDVFLINENQIRTYLQEAERKDLIMYNQSGGYTIVSYEPFFQKTDHFYANLH